MKARKIIEKKTLKGDIALSVAPRYLDITTDEFYREFPERDRTTEHVHTIYCGEFHKW
jgi:hypothetical protein